MIGEKVLTKLNMHYIIAHFSLCTWLSIVLVFITFSHVLDFCGGNNNNLKNNPKGKSTPSF